MILVNDIAISDGGVAWFSTAIDIMMVALTAQERKEQE